MTSPLAAQRAVLLTLPFDSQAAAAVVLGKPVIMRQLEFALEIGCDRVILLGQGSSQLAIALMHAAERAGAHVQSITTAHALPGVVGRDARLLVLQPDLLPDAPQAAEALRAGQGLLSLPAAAGIPAGFERIDRDRAWAGALAVPGDLLDRLLDLPEDSDPGAALLRIALQARLSEVELGADLLADGSWVLLSAHSDLAAIEDLWLDRHLDVPGKYAVSRKLARLVLRRRAHVLLTRAGAAPLLAGLGVVACGVSPALAAIGWPATGVALLAVAALLAEVAIGLGQLRHAPFARTSLLHLLRPLGDAALLATGILALTGSLPQRAFAPLVLLLALLGAGRQAVARWTGLVTDRGLLATLLAVGVAALGPPHAFMAAAVLVLAANAGQRLQERG